jgi:predicted chitinase
MSSWKEFLDYLDSLRGIKREPTPGAVMFCFVNRYLEPMEDIKYRIEFDGKVVTGITTASQHWREVNPASLQPIKVFAWSRVRKSFKLIDEVTPVLGKRLLINEHMKTFKHSSKTLRHPDTRSALPKGTGNHPKQQPMPAHNTPVDRNQQPQGVQPVHATNPSAEPVHQANRAVAGSIEVAQLKKIFPAAIEAYLTKVAAELNTDLPKYKLDTPLRRAHFFAQVRQEAGSSLSPKEESLSYTVEKLKDPINGPFKYYKSHHSEADLDGRIDGVKTIETKVGSKTIRTKKTYVIRPANQEAIANKAYANRREMGNGDVASGDGWRFRGRGIFQLTGRSNYTRFSQEYGKLWSDANPDFATHPEKLVEFPYFIRSAVWFWVDNEIYAVADRGSSDSTIDSVTELVNGTAKHAADKRRANFKNLTYSAFK